MIVDWFLTVTCLTLYVIVDWFLTVTCLTLYVIVDWFLTVTCNIVLSRLVFNLVLCDAVPPH